MKVKYSRLVGSLGIGLVLTLVSGWLLSRGGLFEVQAKAARAGASFSQTADSLVDRSVQAGDVITVCLAEAGACDYDTIQDAIDAADEGAIVKVASGVYTGVAARQGVTQVVYISKSVEIRGGYTMTNDFAEPPDPEENATILDAEGQGRVIYVTGDISTTLEGLHITGGDAAGLGGGWLGDSGGGIYVISATVTISDSQVFGNTSPEEGGGVALNWSVATISNNALFSNTAGDEGGGTNLIKSAALLDGNAIMTNAAGNGGGIFMMNGMNNRGRVILTNNRIVGQSRGEGVYVALAGPLLSDNLIAGNSSVGVRLSQGVRVTELTGNQIFSNGDDGFDCMFGIYRLTGNQITSNAGDGVETTCCTSKLTNAVIADNQGHGIYVASGYPDTPLDIAHATIARNGGESGVGVYVEREAETNSSVLAITNTIIVSHSVGISVTGGNTVTVNGVLWHGVPTTVSHASTATVRVDNQHTGDPVFVDPDGGDYHINAGSAAIDKGVDISLSEDMDGQLRPRENGYDLGADEIGLLKTYLPLVLREYP